MAKKDRRTPDDLWSVYLVKCADGSLYTGIAKDVDRRCRQHNEGTASRYTRNRLPVVLVFEEVHPSRSSALIREAAIKALTRRQKLAVIQSTRRFEVAESMSKSSSKNLLFLCTGNYYRSRYAEVYFNSVAGKMGLPWRATSRGLALERGVNNVGPMAVAAVEALRARGLRAVEECGRFPIQVTAADFEMANWIVALKQAEHFPLLQERFPSWSDRIEFWEVNDAPEVLGLIEREVMDLAARLIGGGRKRVAPPPEIAPEPAQGKQGTSKKTAPVVRLGRETKGRRGKGVTTVADVPLDETGLLALATTFKNRCGTGGTLKDGVIEIQGDQRDRLTSVLEEMGYRVKQVGG